jgi:hypothetical protein
VATSLFFDDAISAQRWLSWMRGSDLDYSGIDLYHPGRLIAALQSQGKQLVAYSPGQSGEGPPARLRTRPHKDACPVAWRCLFGAREGWGKSQSQRVAILFRALSGDAAMSIFGAIAGITFRFAGRTGVKRLWQSGTRCYGPRTRRSIWWPNGHYIWHPVQSHARPGVCHRIIGTFHGCSLVV